jgi:hypothetical protein
MTKIKFERHDRFEKQIKKLIRKYRSLEEDLEIVKKYAIEAFHIKNKDNEALELVPKFDRKTVQIYKIRKFACKALKGKGVRSGIRVIYAFYPEKFEVEFLEIYFKEKHNTDMDYDFARKYIEANTTP